MNQKLWESQEHGGHDTHIDRFSMGVREMGRSDLENIAVVVRGLQKHKENNTP